MEIRARYITIGLFTLGVIAGAFLFVFWLYNANGLTPRDTYRVRFHGSVAGLFSGSGVAFNGLHVGEVSNIALDPADPAAVTVTIGVAPGTPVRADTRAALDFQGLTGSATVALSGGTANAQPLGLAGDGPPLLKADDAASKSVTESARQVMQKLDVALQENSEPMKITLNNLKTFTDALSRNSDRIDGILSGLERMTGGANKKVSGLVVNLPAPRDFKPFAQLPAGQLSIPEPTALSSIDTDKVMLDPNAGPDAAPGQWADVLTKLVQARLVQSFENAGLIGSVLRGSDAASSDYQLQMDIRGLHMVGTAPGLSAEIEVAAKLLDNKGKIIGGRIFKKTTAVAATDPKSAVAGLDAVFAGTAAELVNWAVPALAALPPKAADAAPAQ